MSIFIYSGEDLFRLEEGIKNTLIKYNIDHDHIVTIDAADKRSFNIENVLVECDSFSLFDDDRKAVIVKNPFFLSSSSKEAEKVLKTDSPTVKKRKENEANKRETRLTRLEEYLKNENQNTLLIFACFGFQADSRKKDFKLLTSYQCEIVTFKKMDENEFHSYVEKQLKKNGIILKKDASIEFYERINQDTSLFHAALEKLILYGTNEYTLQDIKHLVSLNTEVNIFHLTSAFTIGDLEGCLKAVDDMLLASYDYTTMISLLSKRLRSIYNMRLLHEQGYSNDEIGTRMHVKSGYVYYVLKDSNSLNSKTVLKYLTTLANIDQGIKQGTLDAKTSFESFLIENGERQNARYQRTI